MKTSIEIIVGGKNVKSVKSKLTELDQEWLQLIIEAKNLGIEKAEVLEYLLSNRIPELIFDK